MSLKKRFVCFIIVLFAAESSIVLLLGAALQKKYLAKLKIKLNNITRAITFSNSFTSKPQISKVRRHLQYKFELAKFAYQTNCNKVS